MSIEATRRAFLAALIGISVGLSATGALADSDDGGGSSGSNSGSGSSNSGSGEDSDDADDSEDDSDEEEDARIGSLEASAAKAAVSEGKAVSLTKLIAFIKLNYPGKVLDVDLKKSSGRYQYRIKILKDTGEVVKLRLDAMTLQLL